MSLLFIFFTASCSTNIYGTGKEYKTLSNSFILEKKENEMTYNTKLFDYNSFSNNISGSGGVIAEKIFSEISIIEKSNSFEVENWLAGIDAVVTQMTIGSNEIKIRLNKSPSVKNKFQIIINIENEEGYLEKYNLTRKLKVNYTNQTNKTISKIYEGKELVIE
jgi:hypothetical protein